ncbi:MAG: outer membrane beta-barrel protein [Bacteroidetes bacterium]|nr:outer membrane beta-barrel protein [Bacteroidota bacterium]
MKALFSSALKGFLPAFSMLIAIHCGAQDDSTNKTIADRLRQIEKHLSSDPEFRKSYDDLTFYYGQMMKYRADSLLHEGFKISGYVDAYYAYYTDDLPLGAFQKFPTSAPVSNTFGLNMAMVSFQYQNEDLNGTLAVHTGDIARSAWSDKYNFIQEAHMGVRLINRLWLEGGFFRTNLGMESIQPRENIGSTIALTTYFEPYYLSGAKLTYYFKNHWLIQVNAFNGFNSFVEVNGRKSYGISIGYEPNPRLAFSFNSIYSDVSAQFDAVRKKRLYNDLYMTYKSKKLILGVEANFGIQSNTKLADSTQSAIMYSATVAAKYNLYKSKFFVYSRIENFNDDNELLTGPVVNSNHQLVGINAIGANLGFEYKAKPNTFLRLESRYIQLNNKEDIFLYNGNFSNTRWEFVSSMGVWF